MHSGSHSFHPNDFSKTLLSWTFEMLSKPLDTAMEQAPLPKNEQNISRFYQNFRPFILEESRAIIANGLEKVDQYNTAQISKKGKNKSLSEARPFNLVLKKLARLPRNEGNPLSMTFKGMIPKDIEHGSSMIVLLLRTKGIDQEMSFIALGTENQHSSELFVKIIISSSDYYDYEECFVAEGSWQAHYLGSVVSEQRMYDACLEATDIPCVQQIVRAQIQDYSATGITNLVEADHLNRSQKQSICAFLNAKKHSTLLLQGPPGTGKTTTLVCLLKQAVVQKKRTLVSAHSNKGVQVLALRTLEKMPDVPMILLGVESKLNEKLGPIFLDGWYDTIYSHLSVQLEHIELLAEKPTSKIGLSLRDFIAEIEDHIHLIKQALIPFNLIYSHPLPKPAKEALLTLTNDPFLISDFQHLEKILDKLKREPKVKEKWKTLLDVLNRLIGKWKSLNEEELKAYLLDHALIVFSTLISAGRKSMLRMAPIDYLVVDEAAQSVEAATLIPMRFQPKKVLLVGDTKQLPATVISTALDDSDRLVERAPSHYQWSMMWRLIEENQQPSLMLTIQYRMHPDICQWPSAQYYENKLITAPTILPMSLLSEVGLLSQPYAVYTVSGQAEKRHASPSVCNTKEAQYVIKIIEDIRRQNRQCSIGVVTPYAAQKQLINESLAQKKHLLPSVDVNTVDGFQGDERDVIIISFTRTHVSEFLKEFRRLNVAITRAKACLIVVCAPTLLSNDIGQLMANARLRKVLHSEQDLNAILTKGRLPVTTQPSARIGLESSAWQGNPEDQFNYAKSLESTGKSKALVWYRRAAENNHPQAQYYVSQCYLSGNLSVTQDTQLSFDWLYKAAKQALPSAQYALGQHFISGHLIEKNVAKGIAYCEQAAQAGLVEALVFLGQCYEEGTQMAVNISRSLDYYRQAAKLNFTPAVIKLAELLAKGSSSNQREAIKWYRKMAAKNNIDAYYPLATLLSDVLNHQEEAFKWYLKAAKNNHAEAQYELGLRFKRGLSPCSVDAFKSADFFRQAAIAGHANAQFRYATCLKEGEGVEKNDVEAMRLFKQLADKYAHAESQYQYALLKNIQSSSQAYTYYLKAALQNHVLAQYACIEYQINSERDLAICLGFCEKLAPEGNIHVLFVLARLLDSGIAGKMDKEKAYLYYAQAANNTHIAAHYYCAIALEEGEGVNQNSTAAREHYEACLEYCIEAKFRLARLLLQEQDCETHEIKAVELLKSYYIQGEQHHRVNLLAQESGVERLITNRLKNTAIFQIDSINTSSIYANYSLGMMLLEGEGIAQDTIKAMKFFKKAADCDHAESCYQWALLTSQVSPDQAYVYFKKAAQQKLPSAQHALGQHFISGHVIEKNVALGIEYCEQAAHAGLVEAIVFLGQCYEEGTEVAINITRALDYYRQAAKLNFMPAIIKLAALLAKGSSNNQREAIKWYQKMALKNEIDVYYPLATLLSDVLDNQTEAFKWYLKAAENNHAEAQYELGLRFKRGLPPCSVNTFKSADFFRQAAIAGHANAQFRYATCLKEGEGVEKNDVEAMRLFKQLADKYAHAESQYQYALLKDIQSSSQAYTYYLKAALQNHVLAQYACIEYQINSERDLAICLGFCEKLAPEGNVEVLFVLARLLDSGIAGKIDKEKAYRYYAQAASNAHILSHYYCAIALEEGQGVNQNSAAAREHYEACLEYCIEAKPRLARLLLQEQDYEIHEIKAIELLKSYYIHGEQHHRVNLLAQENDVERLIANRLKNSDIFSIDSINTDSIYANYSLGRMLIERKENSQNTITAMKFFKKAANCGHAESCYQWALSKSQVSPDMAYIYFKKAALQNHELAQSECIDYQLKHHFDLDICLFFCEKLAIKSDPLQFVLARLLDTGIAGKTDKAQAYHNYLSLAENGHPLAQYYCAMILEEGLVVQKNLIKARHYYEFSSQHYFQARLRLACLLLGDLCQNNEKKPPLSLTNNQIEGINLLTSYCEPHQDNILFISDNVEQNVERLLLASNKKQLVSSLQLNNNYPAKANYLIGRIFQEGKGVDIDNRRALQSYCLAHSEEPDATYRIGYLYETGQGVVKNWAKAKSFYKNAAQRGHQLAAKRSTWSYNLFSQNDLVPDDATLMEKKESNCLIS